MAILHKVQALCPGKDTMDGHWHMFSTHTIVYVITLIVLCTKTTVILGNWKPIVASPNFKRLGTIFKPGTCGL